jgi:hypothetical protein
LRQEILFESANGGSRVSEDLAAFVDQRTASKIDYSRLYPAKVIRQSGDGTLEVLPDSPAIRGNGLTGIPIRHGIPGVRVTVPPGGKVLLFFEAGDPKLPGAMLWPDNSSVLSVELTCASELTITAPTVTINGSLNVRGEITALGDVTAHYPVLPTRLSTHIHQSAVGAVSPPVPGS